MPVGTPINTATRIEADTSPMCCLVSKSNSGQLFCRKVQLIELNACHDHAFLKCTALQNGKWKMINDPGENKRITTYPLSSPGAVFLHKRELSNYPIAQIRRVSLTAQFCPHPLGLFD